MAFCYNCIVIKKEYCYGWQGTFRYRMFTLCNIWNIQDTVEELYSEDKVIMFLKKFDKNGLTLSTTKDPRLQLRVRSLTAQHGETPPWNVGDPEAARIQALLASPAQTVETIANGSIYRLNLSKSKRSEHVLDCV